MGEIFYDPWLVAVVSQIIGGVIAGLIVNQLTKNRSGLSDKEIERLFKYRVRVPRSITFRFLLNWRYLFFYLITLAGIAGITLLQDPSSISWVDIIIYVGKLPSRPAGLWKVPDSKKPRKIRMTGKILIPDAVDGSVFNIDNWRVNLSDFDVR